MPIETGGDPHLAPFIARGHDLFMRRQGQLNLACASCHDDNWDRRLAGSAITQGHPTGYPMYRLEWQSLGSLQRRLRACIFGIRAQPYDYGAPELVDLELYLMSRARGMAIETPAVRPWTGQCCGAGTLLGSILIDGSSSLAENALSTGNGFSM